MDVNNLFLILKYGYANAIQIAAAEKTLRKSIKLALFDRSSLSSPLFEVTPFTVISVKEPSYREIDVYYEEFTHLDCVLSSISPTYPEWIHQLATREDADEILLSIAGTVMNMDQHLTTHFHILNLLSYYNLSGHTVDITKGQTVKELSSGSDFQSLIKSHRYLDRDTICPFTTGRGKVSYYFALSRGEYSLANFLLQEAGGIRIRRLAPPIKNLGIDSCVNSAKSSYLRCAINPLGPCENCLHYEITLQA